MEVSITNINDVEKEISFNVPAAELVPHFDKAYAEYIPKIEIKGFRKGKAPIDLVKKIHGEAIEYDSLSSVASDIYREVVEQRNIKPIGEPALVDMNYKRGEAFAFKIKYEIKPVVQLKDYKGIEIEKVLHKVTDKELEDEILRLRKANSTLAEAQTATDDEHVITADVQELDQSGTPLIGKKDADARFYLGDETLHQQIKDALKGSSAGESKRMTIETKHEDHSHTNHLQITVKKVEKVVLPEFNDELVKKTTKDKVTSTDEFREQLRDDLENYWKERSDRKVIDAIITEVVKRHEITVPESLVRGVQESLLEDVKNRYPNKKLPKEFNEETFREQNHDYASFQAKWFLIREQMIETEKMTVDDADLEKQAEGDAPKMGIEKEKLVSFYKSSDAVKERILSEKLISFLKEKSNITEKVTEEFIE